MANVTIGTTLTKKKGGSESTDWKIAHLTSIGEIGVESEEIDTTDLDSVGGYKEFQGGLKDAGELSLAGNIYDYATVEKMLSLVDSQSIESWEVKYPSGATWNFSGFVKSFKDGEKTAEGLVTFSATIRISGKPDFSTATA